MDTILIFGMFYNDGSRGGQQFDSPDGSAIRRLVLRGPRSFHAAHGRGKPGSKVERALDGLGAILTTLGGIEIAHQKRGEERVARPHGVLHVRYRFSQLAVITLAVVSNAALGARRSRHKTRTQTFTHARRSRISSSLAASAALKKAKST